ncbi:hypothetical protein BT96DRAFT_1030180, partial [Gymnopus androsaceus JB14]
KLVILIFTVTLFAFVAESQLTQYVQTTLNYRKPFFIFWIVHSSFVIALPCHLLYLALATPYSLSALWKGLVLANVQHLNGTGTDVFSSRSPKIPVTKITLLMLALTAAISLPAGLWFISIELASVTDVTAIWNTNAFFAYLLTVKIFGLKWETRKLAAVVLATLGVLAVVYGGSTASSPSETAEEAASTQSFPKLGNPLMGDLLTLIASVCYAGYQVFYKKYVALASDPEFDEYQPLSASEDREVHPPEGPEPGEAVYPPPFGLYSNFWSSAIGACTFFVLWFPIPILHLARSRAFCAPGQPHYGCRNCRYCADWFHLQCGIHDHTRAMGSYHHVCRRSIDHCPRIYFRYYSWCYRHFDVLERGRVCYDRRRVRCTCLRYATVRPVRFYTVFLSSK